MPVWLRYSLTYLLLAGLLIAAFGVDWQNGISLLLLGGTLLPLIVRRSPRLHLWFQRAWYYLTNAETTWELALQFRGNVDLGRLDAFIENLVQEDKGGSLLLQSSTSRRLIRLHRIFTVEFVLNEGVDRVTANNPAGPESIDVILFEQQVGFRRSKAMLEDSLIPFFERLRDALQPESTSYALRVRFPRTNPFLGMYLQQLRPELVRDFQFEFTLPSAGPGDYVRVDRGNMVVWSGSIQSFRRSALAGLTFSSAAR